MDTRIHAVVSSEGVFLLRQDGNGVYIDVLTTTPGVNEADGINAT